MLFYFSGTGNSQWIAQQIAETLGEQLYSIPETMQADCKFTLSANETIGFVYPTHGWQPPHIVRQFIRNLHITFNHQPYCYAITTCGDNTGLSMNILHKALCRKGLKLTSTFSVIMPESYVALPFMYTDSEKKEAEKINAAKKRIPEIIKTLKNREKEVEDLEKGVFPWLLTYVIGGFFNRFMISDHKFKVDQNRCIHCNKCEKICPTHNISCKEIASPIWMHQQCTACLACYHHCPVHAISYGHITEKRGQYFFGHNKNKKEQ